MPELPEVETYVRELEPELYRRAVTAAQVHWQRIIAAPSAGEFVRAIVGMRFSTFGRRGKYMLFGMESDHTLIVHLRMTGNLQIKDAGDNPDKHTHVVLDMDDGRRLHYQDSRKFGRMWLVRDPATVLGKLGPEPLGADFTVLGFAEKLQGRKASIKALLLDQRILAGVGNIYADEALYLAHIRPSRAGGQLDATEVERLHAGIQFVLQQGIEKRGSSLGNSRLQNYQRLGGEQGGFQEEHKVFQRTGKPCPTCGTPIERIVLAQRSTHFCPICQR